MTAADPSQALETLASSALDAMLSSSPFSATMLGIPGYDDRVPQVTEADSASLAARFREIAASAESIEPARLTSTERTTRLILISECTNNAEVADLRTNEFDTAPMFVAPHAPILQTVPKTVLPDQTRAEAYLERLSKLASYLDSSGEQLRIGTAKGRTPAARSLSGSIGSIDAYLASDLETDLLHSPTAPEFAGKAEWEQRRTAIVRDEIRPAMQRIRDLYTDLLATARPDDKVGVSWLPDGEHIYEVKARASTTTTLKPRELHELGLSVLEQLEVEYAEIGSRAIGTSDPAAVRERMRNDDALKLSSVEQLLEISQEALDRCKAALPQWFGLLPDSDCVMKQIPDAEAVTSAPAYYTPPDKSADRPGIYWVNGHAITNRAMFDVETIAFHEAIPGHHMQLAIAQELHDLPLYRRVNIVTAYAEGWGLYTERLADEMGLYSSDVQRLGMLSCDAWRACRLVVDTGLHALGWSFQKSVDFMSEHCPIALSVILPEVDRYVGMPGQALGYMVGRLEIQRLRREAEASMGERFDISGFHDVVLRGGSVPMTVLEAEVRNWSNPPEIALS